MTYFKKLLLILKNKLNSLAIYSHTTSICLCIMQNLMITCSMFNFSIKIQSLWKMIIIYTYFTVVRQPQYSTYVVYFKKYFSEIKDIFPSHKSQESIKMSFLLSQPKFFNTQNPLFLTLLVRIVFLRIAYNHRCCC